MTEKTYSRFLNLSDGPKAETLASSDSGGQAVLATTEAFRREAARLVSQRVCKDCYDDHAV